MLKAVDSGSIFWRAPRALNDNLPAVLADDLATSLGALRAFRLPEHPPAASTAAAFRGLRLALLAEQHGTGITGRRNPVSRRDVERAMARLGAAPCVGAGDLAMKALAFRTLASCTLAHAASRHDPAVLVADAEAMAELMAQLAADAMALSGQAVAL